MTQITARLPEELVQRIDQAATQQHRSRAQVLRQAVEYYLEDLQDLDLAIERLKDPADIVLNWQDVRHELLHQDQE